MPKQSKRNHRGTRKGAGRPPLDPEGAVPITLRIPMPLYRAIQEDAGPQEISAWIRQACKAQLERHWSKDEIPY